MSYNTRDKIIQSGSKEYLPYRKEYLEIWLCVK